MARACPSGDFGRDRLTADDLVRNNTLTPAMLELLRGCVKARLNILISGGTGAGKTTLLNVLSSLHFRIASAS